MEKKGKKTKSKTIKILVPGNGMIIIGKPGTGKSISKKELKRLLERRRG